MESWSCDYHVTLIRTSLNMGAACSNNPISPDSVNKRLVAIPSSFWGNVIILNNIISNSIHSRRFSVQIFITPTLDVKI